MCRTVGLELKIGKNERCPSCKSNKNENDILEDNILPIWYDETGQANYKVPNKLQVFTLAEKMLKQLVSPFVPLVHIKNGTMGISGHVCAFEQNVTSFVDTLPRLNTDTTVIRVLKSIRTEIGDRTENCY